MDVQSLSAIKKARASIEAKLGALGTSIGAKVDTLGTSLGGKMDNVIASVRALPATLDSKFAVTNGKVDAVSTSLTNVANELTTIKGDVDTVGSRIDEVKSTGDKISKLVTRDDLLIKNGPVSVSGKGKLYAFIGTRIYPSSNDEGPTLNLTVDNIKCRFSTGTSYSAGYNSTGLYCPKVIVGSTLRDSRVLLTLLNGTSFGIKGLSGSPEGALDCSAFVNGATIDAQIVLNKPIEFNSGFTTSTTTIDTLITTIYSLDE